MPHSDGYLTEIESIMDEEEDGPGKGGLIDAIEGHENIVRVNVFDQDMDMENPPQSYLPLEDLISFEGFRFDETYRDQEVMLLQPQLVALGYNYIEWLPGEVDSFGPLTRVCKALSGGQTYWFIYG